MPILILIRHAETDYVGKRLAGHLPDIHLNKRGKQQAENLAIKLSEIPITKIYTSPLERAFETAEPLAHRKGLSINILQALMEIDLGDWQGRSLPALRRLKRWQATHDEPARFSFPNGESFRDKQQVMCTALEMLMREAGNNEIIACVSHADPIKLCLAYFLGLELNNFQRIIIDTASASFIYFSGNRIRLGPINLVDSICLKRPSL
ncbi:MAG: histidine phosphatase family protein [Anaerolineaceae bacterium]